MPQPELLTNDRQLRRNLRDLVALSTLPAVWVGCDSRGVAEGLAGVLANVLSLDFVFIRLREPGGLEVARGSLLPDLAERAGMLRDVLAPVLDADPSRPPVSSRMPQAWGGGSVRVLRLGLGPAEMDGVLVAGSRRPDFPGESDRLLITMGANQAAIVIQRKKAEGLVQESERHLRELIDALPAAIYTTDSEGRLTHYNRACVDFSGRVPNLGSDKWCVSWKLFHPDGTPMSHEECPMAVALKEGRAVRGAEAIAERPDGRRIWFVPYPIPLRDPDGRIVGGVNMLVDITPRKATEAALRRSEQELADFFDNASVGLHWVGPDGTILRANQAELNMLGYAREEYVGRNIAEFHADPAVIADIMRRLAAGETLRDREARMRSKDGSIRYVLIDSSVMWENGEFIHTRCFTRDITAKKRAEHRLAAQYGVTHILAESESLPEAATGILRSICECLGWDFGALWSVDEQSKVLRCSDVWHRPSLEVPRFVAACRERTFAPGVGLPGRVWSSGTAAWIPDVVDDDNFPRGPIADSEGLHGAFGFPIMLNGQVQGVVEFFSHEIRQPDSDLLQMVTAIGSQMGQFVERKRAAKALRESEERYRHLVGMLPVAVYSCDASGAIAFYNQRAAELWGRAPRIGEPDERFCGSHRLWRPDGGALPHDRTPMAAALKEGRAFRNEDVVIERPDGTHISVLVNIDPVRDAEGRVVGAINAFHDVTALKSTQEALQRSEERYRSLTQAITSVLWTTDETGRFVTPQPSWSEYTGQTWDEMRDLGWLQAVHPEDRERVHSLWEEARARRDHYRAEGRLWHAASGSYRHFEARGVPVLNADGSVREWVGKCLDVEDRKKAEGELRKQTERLRLLWDAAAVLLTADDPDSMLRALLAKIGPHLGVDAYFNYLVNDSGDALRLASCHGIPVEMARSITRLEFGQAICGTVAAELRPIVATHVQRSDDPKTQLIRSLGIRAYACNPLLVDHTLLGTLSFASRTKEQFSPDELAFMNTISHYVTVAYERLRLMNQLTEADRRKDEFLATLAHELRNPLAPVRNAVHLLRLKGSNEPDLRWTREVIERQVEYLTRLIDDLLDVSRITRNQLELRKQPVELAEVINGAVESSRPAIEECGHELKVTLPSRPIYLSGDLVRLAQVFLNLLNNAAKYTERGGRIWLTAEQHDAEVVVRVKDSGVGIPADKLPRLFEMFFQVDRSLGQGGLGIGLALVRRLVELHGGRVEARSEGVGKGSEFIVRLPILAEEPKRPPTMEAYGSGNGHKPSAPRILVVDDNRDAADSLAMLLRLAGSEVGAAYDGLEGLKAAEKSRPDVVLLDIGMPKLNGHETCRRIRSQAWGGKMVLIALTGWGRENDRLQTVEAGFDAHLVKPVDPTALLTLLPSLLAERNGGPAG